MLVAEGQQDQLAMRPRYTSCLTCRVQNPTLTGHRERGRVNEAAVPQVCPRTAETLSRT